MANGLFYKNTENLTRLTRVKVIVCRPYWNLLLLLRQKQRRIVWIPLYKMKQKKLTTKSFTSPSDRNSKTVTGPNIRSYSWTETSTITTFVTKTGFIFASFDVLVWIHRVVTYGEVRIITNLTATFGKGKKTSKSKYLRTSNAFVLYGWICV